MKQTSDHTCSYYAATANWETDYPVLRGRVDADVCVVGGGFTGVSTALHLLERGYSVVLLEGRKISWGASGRNGGQLVNGVADETKVSKLIGRDVTERVWQFGLETTEIVKERVAQFDIQCDLKWGYMNAALNDDQIKELEEYQQQCAEYRYPHSIEYFSKERIKEVIGSDQYVAALVDYGSGHLHPLNLCIGEARAAEQMGAQIYEHSMVKKIIRGTKPVVKTHAGEVHAEHVVVGCNAYLNGLLPEIDGMALSAGSYVIATEPLTQAEAQEVNPKDLAVCDMNVVLDYFRLSADRRMLFGGRCNYSGLDPVSISGTLQPRMAKVFPLLADKQIDYEWGGDLAISINRIPQLGRLKGNVYYAQGYSGHGVGPTHLAGRMIADAIAGTAEDFDVFERVKHWKLPGGRLFGNPMLALGMLYYRLRDVMKSL